MGRMVNESKPGARVRITNQFRKRDAMVYDLSCDEVRLTLEISFREGDHGREQWNVEAFARQAPERPTVNDSGETRHDALRAVARAWVDKHGVYGFPTLDWDAVAAALLAVQAL